MASNSTVQKTVRKVGLYEKHSDFAYWQTQPHEARLATLEQIRREYHHWSGDPMILGKDFSELIRALNAHDVQYLVVGGYAVALHGHPRYTKDLDVWIGRTPDNAAKLVRAIDQFGFASLGLKESDFLEADQIIQLGYPPNRIDLLTSIPGVEFSACYASKVVSVIETVPVNFIDLDNLKKNKKASERKQDLADLENLE